MLKCVCVVVVAACYGAWSKAQPPFFLLSVPICIWSYYCENIFFFFFFFVCAWAHTLLVIMVSEVCDVLE